MNGQDKDRMTVVETQIDDLKDDLGEVKTDVKVIINNHLPHIRTQIAALDKSVAINAVKISFGSGIISLMASTLVNWLFR